MKKNVIDLASLPTAHWILWLQKANLSSAINVKAAIWIRIHHLIHPSIINMKLSRFFTKTIEKNSKWTKSPLRAKWSWSICTRTPIVYIARPIFPDYSKEFTSKFPLTCTFQLSNVLTCHPVTNYFSQFSCSSNPTKKARWHTSSATTSSWTEIRTTYLTQCFILFNQLSIPRLFLALK